VGRLIAFMRSSPDVRMVLTPVITVGDLDALKREELAARIERMSQTEHVTAEAATAALFRKRFPDRQPPGRVEEIIAALIQDEDPPEAAARKLAANRLGAGRDGLKKAGIETARREGVTEDDAAEIETGGGAEFRPHDHA